MTASRLTPHGKFSRTTEPEKRPVVGSYQAKAAELFNKQIGSYIEARRRQLGQTQEIFALKVGVSTNTVWRWEAGYQITMPHLLLVCDYLQIKPWELLQRAVANWKDNRYAA